MDSRFDTIAREALARPITEILSLLPRAERTCPMEVEVIHQLRVQTRRLEAAIHLFKPFLEPTDVRRSFKELKRLRRSLAPIRDWDVFEAFVRDQQPKLTVMERPGADFLLGYSIASRSAAEEIGRRSLRRVRRNRLTHLERFPSIDVQDPIEHARKQLHALRSKIQAGLASPSLTPTQIHDLRKRVKRLRYTLDILKDLAEPSKWKDFRKEITKMQDHLGSCHDAHCFDLKLFETGNVLGAPPAARVGLRSLKEDCRKVGLHETRWILAQRSVWLNPEMDARINRLFSPER